MTNQRPSPDPAGATMVRWIFRRDARTLACEVDARGNAYDVAVVPLWDREPAIVERFAHPMEALELHASIARELRARGWVVVDHAIPNHVAVH